MVVILSVVSLCIEIVIKEWECVHIQVSDLHT